MKGVEGNSDMTADEQRPAQRSRYRTTSTQGGIGCIVGRPYG
jgi:hypothetical protein